MKKGTTIQMMATRTEKAEVVEMDILEQDSLFLVMN